MFVILSNHRSGTNLLKECLNQNPDICCLGELFNPRWSSFARNRAPTEQVFAFVDSHKQHNGFILQNTQTRAGVFDKLLACGAKLIWLKRQDHLARYVSLLIACHTELWITSQPVTNTMKVKIELDMFQRYITEIETSWEKWKDKGAIAVDYDALVSDLVETTNRVQRWIGAKPVSVVPTLRMIERRPLRDVVTNYEEVMAFLRQAAVGNVAMGLCQS